MTQNNGFLGTIGWIKGNLMSSSQASQKGYSNETFYPGLDNVPESEKFYTRRKIQIGAMQSYHVVGGIAKLYNNFSWGYIRVDNFPELKTCSEFKIHANILYGGPILAFLQPSSSYRYWKGALATFSKSGIGATLRETTETSPFQNWLSYPDPLDPTIWTDFEYSFNRKNKLNTIEIWNGDIHKKYTTTFNTYTDSNYFYLGPFSYSSGATGQTIQFKVDNCWFEFKE